MPESNFFSEEATRQILKRIADVFNDPELCDAVFVLGDGEKEEEIPAPSQFMAASSTYFKELFYPPLPNDDKKRVIEGMQPNVFRKILDYLFKGKVPLNSIDDAWKVKVAGRTFRLKDLEELTTKFLKYRLDSQNLLVYLKNSSKYDCPDLREVIVNRFLKEAMVVLDDPGILNLSEEELLHLIEKEPEVQAKKMMSVLIKWAKKRQFVPEQSDEPLEKKQKLDEEKGKGKDDTEKKEGDVNSNKEDEVKIKKEEGEENDAKEKNDDSKEDNKNSNISTSLVEPLQPFVSHIHWDHGDAEFFLKEVRNKNVLSEEAENVALTEMLKSFVERKPIVTERIGRRPTMAPASRRGAGRPAVERGPASGPDLAVVGEKRSKNPGSGGVIVNKTDDDMPLT